MSDFIPSVTAAPAYSKIPNDSNEDPPPSPSISSLVDSIETALYPQKISRFQKRALLDAKVSRLIPFVLQYYQALFGVLNAMAKVIIAGEIARDRMIKEKKIHEVFVRAHLERMILHQEIIKETIQSHDHKAAQDHKVA